MQYLITISYQSFAPYVKTWCIGKYVTFALWHEPSVCVCSLRRCCTRLRPTQRVKIFVNIFAASNRLGTWQFVLDIHE